MIATAELQVDAQCELGEGPLWHDGNLYWFDILQSRLHQFSARSATHSSQPLPDMFSAAGVASDGSLLMASATALWSLRLETNTFNKLMDVPQISATGVATRTNDGRADRHGGFWLSTMGRHAENQAGSIYRYYLGELREIHNKVTIPNALCFAPDGACVYFADTDLDTIWTQSLDSNGWPVGEPRVFVDKTSAAGRPDGAVVDEQGALWNARWGAGEVVRFLPNGEVSDRIKLPVSCPTCPAYGGADLSTLYITTAWEGFDTVKRQNEPLAGGLFRHALRIRGLPDGKIKV